MKPEHQRSLDLYSQLNEEYEAIKRRDATPNELKDFAHKLGSAGSQLYVLEHRMGAGDMLTYINAAANMQGVSYEDLPLVIAKMDDPVNLTSLRELRKQQTPEVK